jgi:hypothetical protein
MDDAYYFEQEEPDENFTPPRQRLRWRVRVAMRHYLAKKRRFGLNVYANHAWSVSLGRNVQLHVWHRMRGGGFDWEWHNHDGVRYISVSWSDPKAHRWWATHAVLYLTH